MSQTQTLSQTTYEGRLAALRKTHALMPFIAPVNVTFAQRGNADPSPPFQEAQKEHNKPYRMLARELAGVSTIITGQSDEVTQPTRALDTQCEVTLKEGAQGTQIGNASVIIPHYLGRGEDGWRRYRSGMMLEANTPYTVAARSTFTLPRVDPPLYQEHEGTFAFRGYRLWDLGSVTPLQKTYREYAEAGYKLKPYPMTVKLFVPALGTSDASVSLTFPEDMVIDDLSFNNSFETNDRFHEEQQTGLGTYIFGQTHAGILVKIDPVGGRELFDDFAPMALVGSTDAAAKWDFEIPLTVAKASQWTVRVKTRIPMNHGLGQWVTLFINASQLVKP